MIKRVLWLSSLIVVGLVTVIFLRQGVTSRASSVPAAQPEAGAVQGPVPASTAVAAPRVQPTAIPPVRLTVVPPVGGGSSELQSFTHPLDKYTFKYPSNWYLTASIEPGSNVILTNYEATPLFKAPRGGLQALIKVQVGYGRKPLNQTLQDFIASSYKGDRDTGVLQSITPFTVAGQPGFKLMALALDPYLGDHPSVSVYLDLGSNSYVYAGAFPANSDHIGEYWKLVESLQLPEQR